MRLASGTLGDELAALLGTLGTASGDALARLAKRRRAEVLRTLTEDPRFLRRGFGRWTRWQLVPESHGDGGGNARDGKDGVGEASATPSSFEAGESLSGVRCSDPSGHASARAHWLGDDGVTHCVRCEVVGIRPLSYEEWCEGLGGEDVRDLFERDLPLPHYQREGTEDRL